MKEVQYLTLSAFINIFSVNWQQAQSPGTTPNTMCIVPREYKWMRKTWPMGSKNMKSTERVRPYWLSTLITGEKTQNYRWRWDHDCKEPSSMPRRPVVKTQWGVAIIIILLESLIPWILRRNKLRLEGNEFCIRSWRIGKSGWSRENMGSIPTRESCLNHKRVTEVGQIHTRGSRSDLPQIFQ